MASRTQKVKVGMFVLGAVGLLVAALVFVGSYSWWRDRQVYYAWYDGSVGGLESGAPVHVHGVRVGDVRAIELLGETETRVRVTMSIAPEAPIREGAVAQLTRMGLSSLMYIDILGGNPGAGMAEPGSVLEGRQPLLERAADKAFALVDRTEQLIARGEGLMQNLEQLTGESTQAQVDAILASAAGLVATLDETARQVRAASGQARALLSEGRETIRDLGGDVGEAVDDAQLAAANANALFQEAQRVLRLNEDQVRATLQNLRVASQSVKELGRMLRAQPSRLLFSDAPEERKLP